MEQTSAGDAGASTIVIKESRGGVLNFSRNTFWLSGSGREIQVGSSKLRVCVCVCVCECV